MANAAVAPPTTLAFEQRLLTTSSPPAVTPAPVQLPKAVSALVASLIPPHSATTNKSPLTLTTLPSELHLRLMDYLDPLDMTCLGLTSHHFYTLYRRNLTIPLALPTSVMYLSPPSTSESATKPTRPSLGPRKVTPVSLYARRLGRNNQEYAFTRYKSGEMCRFCGVERCQLWRHVEELFPKEEWEYCGVSGRFGRRDNGGEGVEGGKHEGCWRSCPPSPRTCGKHSKPNSPAQTPVEEKSQETVMVSRL